MNVKNYLLYYRKISDSQFITTADFKNDLIAIIENFSNNLYNYIIIGLYSGSIYIPTKSNLNEPNSIYIQQTYNFIIPSNLNNLKIPFIEFKNQ
jgi:hypothetical protein